MSKDINKLIKEHPEKFDFADIPPERKLTDKQRQDELAKTPEWFQKFVARG